MSTYRAAWLLLSALALAPGAARSGPACDAAPLSDAEIEAAIAAARATRTDLPPPFPSQRTVTREGGCHHLYIEYALPAAPDRNHIFQLNRQGVIVDVQAGRAATGFQCPGDELTQDDLADVVARARANRDELPQPYPQRTVRVSRLRCLYLYFEYNVPERRGDHQVFIIDPLGELMSYQRSDPY